MQNAGVQPDPQIASQLTPGFKDQAALMSAHTDAFTAQTNATKTQADMINQATDTNQVPNPQDSENSGDEQNESPMPVQEGQQVTAQDSDGSDNEQQESANYQLLEAINNPVQRLMEIQELYNVDQETAAGIAAAMDHGVSPEQYLGYVGGQHA
jgi:hypothetical protein